MKNKEVNFQPLNSQLIKIAIGSDHAGFKLKEEIKVWLLSLGYQVQDVGCHTDDRTDFVVYAQKVAHLIAQKKVNYGLLCCFSGVGVNIASNRFRGVRALRVNINEKELVSLARQHNDVNLLTFGSHFTNLKDAQLLLKIFFQTPFNNLLRYKRRNQLLDQKSS